jgi:hypothetical protein
MQRLGKEQKDLIPFKPDTKHASKCNSQERKKKEILEE